MFQSDVAILTGAGASIPVGVPGMVRMATEFAESLRPGSQAEAGFRLLRELGSDEDVEELLQLATMLTEFRQGPLGGLVERGVAPRGDSAALRHFKKRLDADVDSIEEMRSTLLSWITRACLQFDRPAAQNIYGGVVGVVAERGIPVFSTNYDAVWDYVATSKGIPIVDNFVTDKFGRDFWDDRLQSFAGEGLQLVKIHGSIHWHRDPVGRVEKLGQPAPVNQEGATLQQLLIFPTRFKDIYEPTYFPLYTAFTRCVGQSSLLMVVGHSLRDEYLLAAIRERLRDTKFTLVVVDPSFPARETLRDAAAHPDQIIHFQLGVERLAPLIEQALALSHVADVIELLREASASMTSSRRERLAMPDLPTWVSPGQRLSVELVVDTVLSDGRLEASLRDAEGTELPLRLESLDEGFDIASCLVGRHSLRVPVEISLPENLVAGQSYRFTICLRGAGDEIQPVERSLRVRKHPKGKPKETG